ncbi:hypothetical protein [Brevundimonas kwangchunensis]
MFRSLDEARAGWEAALVNGASNSFLWHGSLFRVDRARGFVFAGDPGNPSGVVPPEEDEVDIYAGEYQLEDVGQLSRAWASLLGGFQRRAVWEISLAKFFNLAVVQPRVNPAFGPLFWLFLADDSGPGPVWDWSENMFHRVSPMIFQLSEHPDLVPSPAEVRQAQIAFLESGWPGSTDATCAGLSEEDWTRRCEAMRVEHQQMVDDRFFDRILERIDAETGGAFD